MGMVQYSVGSVNYCFFNLNCLVISLEHCTQNKKEKSSVSKSNKNQQPFTKDTNRSKKYQQNLVL